MATISIEKQENEKFRVRVWSKRDAFGKRRSKQENDISGYVAAKKRAKELMYELEAEQTPKDLTFEQLDDMYFKERKTKVSPTTLANTFKYDRKLAREHFGKVKAANINTKMLQDYIDKLEQRNLREHTVKNYAKYVSTVLRWGVNEDILDFYKIKKLHYKKDEEPFEATTLTLDQTAELLNFMRVDDYNLFIPTLLSTLTGARRGEVLGLTWDDIDFENNIIYFRNNLVPIEGQIISKKILKTKSSRRMVALCDFLKKELLKHKPLSVSKQVCSNVFNGDITPDYLTKQFPIAAETLFNIHMREHDTRQNFSQLIYENENLLEERAKIMGHSDKNTTLNVYTRHRVTQKERDLLNAFGSILEEKMCQKMCQQ